MVEPLQDFNSYGQELMGADQTSCGDLAGVNLCIIDQSAMLFVLDNQVPGKYSVSYRIADFGRYALNITLRGQHISGSPFNLTVAPQPPPLQKRAKLSDSATQITVDFEDRVSPPVTMRPHFCIMLAKLLEGPCCWRTDLLALKQASGRGGDARGSRNGKGLGTV